MTEKNINVLKKLDRLLNLVIGCSIGAAIGYALYVYWECQKYPLLYAARSAPWYTGILVNALAAAIISLIAVAAKCIIRRKIKRAVDET